MAYRKKAIVMSRMLLKTIRFPGCKSDSEVCSEGMQSSAIPRSGPLPAGLTWSVSNGWMASKSYIG